MIPTSNAEQVLQTVAGFKAYPAGTLLALELAGTIALTRVAAREWGDNVVFLHKVEPGPADRAYGIHVAKLAGVPKPVVRPIHPVG